MKHNSKLKNIWLRRAACSLATIFTGMLLSNVYAQSTLPFYEPFPSSANPFNGLGYNSPENLGTGTPPTTTSGQIWTVGNGASGSSAHIMAAAALTYPGLTNVDALFATYGLQSTPAASSVKNRDATLIVPNNPAALYASCLLNFQQITNTTTWQFFGLTTNIPTTGVEPKGASVSFDTSGRLLIAKDSVSPATNATYALVTNTTYLVVIRYKFNPGAPDQVDLWLDPTSLGDDASVPAPTITTTNNANVSANYFGGVAYFQTTAHPTLFYLDEIRVATNWAAVTPTTPAPGTTYAVTGGGSGCLGDSFLVGLSGSDLNVTYLLYTNGVFAGLTANGTGSSVSFGAQSTTAFYTVLATNNVSSNVGWMSGSASVTVLSPPSIVSQLISVVVATNGLGAFNVSATGTGLNYQWYRNGVGLADGGHVSGSQTTNLVISPATIADVATTINGYYVIITNRCGASATSTTNALTLDAPASLVWSGDGVSNLWDVGTSTNWNTQTAVFNYGDNVIFDDTSANTTVNLANNYLSPASILVNGGGIQSFTFSGGSLTGTGSLVMNSIDTLNLTVPNTMSGGITISNGIVHFNSASGLGTGTITMAGGTLDSQNLPAITVNNPINVVADSIIQANSTQTSALILANTLSGSAGTLTIRNNVGGTPTIQLTGSGFNFGRPIILDPGFGLGLIVSGNNTTGTQTYSGVISGSGTLGCNFGGNMLLSAANTYSGGTLLRNGTIGIGIDSVSSSPPTVDSGALGTGVLSIDPTTVAPTLFASGGAHSVDNPINYTTATIGSALVINGNNDLTFNGAFDLMGDRTIQVDNTGKTIFTGDISDGGLTKTGNGALYLNGVNDYSDPTIVSSGTLGGTGTIASPVTVNSGATLAPGASVGTLTINSDLTLNGNLAIEVNKSLSPSNDLVVVNGVLTNGGNGTLTVNNLGPALVVGNKFTLFSKPLLNGGALAVSGGGVNWQNNLAVNGSITIASIISQPPLVTSTTTSGANLIFKGTNGTAGATYYVLSSTNLTLPRLSWKREQTNTFGFGGSFSVTNAIGTGAKFFLLQLQ
jgi:autotransporter-associated beta strand protein